MGPTDKLKNKTCKLKRDTTVQTHFTRRTFPLPIQITLKGETTIVAAATSVLIFHYEKGWVDGTGDVPKYNIELHDPYSSKFLGYVLLTEQEINDTLELA